MVYLICLGYGHRWENAGGLVLEGGLQEDEFRCRCKTRRYDTWHIRTRKTVGRLKYTRPPEYRLGYRVTREDAKQVLRSLGWYEVERLLADEL
jgi:hypothetical protein